MPPSFISTTCIPFEHNTTYITPTNSQVYLTYLSTSFNVSPLNPTSNHYINLIDHNIHPFYLPFSIIFFILGYPLLILWIHLQIVIHLKTLSIKGNPYWLFQFQEQRLIWTISPFSLICYFLLLLILFSLLLSFLLLSFLLLLLYYFLSLVLLFILLFVLPIVLPFVLYLRTFST